MRLTVSLIAAALWISGGNVQVWAQTVERTPILFDTDLGSEIDDAFALGLIFGSHEVDLRGITTVSGNTEQRAMMLCRFLTNSGRRSMPVAVGQEPQPPRAITGQYQYYYHPDVLFDRTKKPDKQSAVDFIEARLRGQPGKISLLVAGPLTNIARLIREKPEAIPLVRRIVLVESNLKLDIAAAKAVFASRIPLVIVPDKITAGLTLAPADVEKVFRPSTALSRQVETLYQLWDQKQPPLADVVAAALTFEERFAGFEVRLLEIDDQGAPKEVGGKPNARVVTSLDRDAFVKWYVQRMAALVPPERNPSRLVEQGGMPARIHVAEDYDSDIERRWWMSGKAETANLPPRGVRACRGVLTHDFDDLLMVSRQMYTAVIFNPVPGPPMGKNTRLSFRYWLKGTDTLRVQIYSLTNGYHRHLVVPGLPQESWQQATVDMTQARRPDGTGGPLGENERIDDIQFYIAPDAELVIDDVVLFDAAVPAEKRPFPKRILFTGGFDTGKQGKEWPGTFEIVADQGSFWRAAKSVTSDDRKTPWIRLHLRGPRSLGSAARLSFRYRLSGIDRMSVLLIDSAARSQRMVDLESLKTNQWTQTTLELSTFKSSAGDSDKGPSKSVDEIHFLLPNEGELLLDDVLLYEPGAD